MPAAAGITLGILLLPMNQNFDTNYDLHYGEISRYCIWKCHDNDIGQDLTQETFLRYWNFLQRAEEVPHVRAFLYRVAHNLFVDHTRKKREASLDHMLETGFEPSVDPWHTTYDRLDAEQWFKKINTMQTPYRNILHQRFVQGLAPGEIAKMTGETSNTVSVRIHRGLQRLRS